MFCRAHNTPDVGEFPLTACEYELFDSTSICLPGCSSLPPSLFYLTVFELFSLPLCVKNSPTEQTRTHMWNIWKRKAVNLTLCIWLIPIISRRILSMICTWHLLSTETSNRLESIVFFFLSASTTSSSTTTSEIVHLNHRKEGKKRNS